MRKINKHSVSILAMLILGLLIGSLSASEPNHAFAFRPDSISGYHFGDTGISIEMIAKAKIIDSIRVRVYPWIDGRYQVASEITGGAGIVIPDAAYLYDFSLTDNIRLKKRRQKIRILGVDPCPTCRLHDSKFDIRIRFFAKQDSSEIKVIQEKTESSK